MRRIRKAGALVVAVVGCLATGCSIDVHKTNQGEDKDVAIHTPFGGMHVATGAEKPIDTGLPVYPGATPEKKKSNDSGSVDLHMGFGPWELRVQVASYDATDPENKVQAFYTKALGQYGQVLTCRGKQPVGSVKRTTAGLTCADDGSDEHIHTHTGDADLELKAGSPQHQHIVAFTDKGASTNFALVALTLPRGSDKADTAE